MFIGFNYLILVVVDLLVSIVFYCDFFGFCLEVCWDQGVYFELGLLWLCLFWELQYGGLVVDYMYYVFGIVVVDFVCFVVQLCVYGVCEWKQNCSEGDLFYFFDLDGYCLEVYVGDLCSWFVVCW